MNLNARFQSVKELFQNHSETCSSVILMQSYSAEKPKTILLTSVDNPFTFH